MDSATNQRVPLAVIAKEWGRIGIIGFGGPPTHIALFRERCVERNHWISSEEFEDAIAATNLLPGPASTQLAIFLAWRLRQNRGALLGGFCFIGPGLVIILALSALFLTGHPPIWVAGIAAGAGAAVPAVALHASIGLIPASWNRVRGRKIREFRWLIYALLGTISVATIGPYLVTVLLGCGTIEMILERPSRQAGAPMISYNPLVLLGIAGISGLGGLSWVALKVGVLSYGGGFIIIPLMQHDAVNAYHWMTASQFLNAVALGQITPGPVVQTVAVVGYAAAGIGGGLLAAAIAFGPSFLFVIIGGPHFLKMKTNRYLQTFLTGAGATSIGAIAGSSIPLTLAIAHLWQGGILVLAGIWFLIFKRNLVVGLIMAGALGAVASLAGAPIH